MAEIIWTETALEQYDEVLAPIYENNIEVGVSINSKVEETLEILTTYPESFPVVAEPLRKLSIPGYPFVLYYEYRGDGFVRIAAFFHDKQNRPARSDDE